TAAFATRVGLGGWLLIGLLANLLGAAALETYREVQRGLEHYVRQAVFYVLANAVQLVVVLVASSLDFQSPSLFLVVYGLSSLAALVLMAPSGGDLRLDLGALRWRRMAAIVGLVCAVLLHRMCCDCSFCGECSVVHICGV